MPDAFISPADDSSFSPVPPIDSVNDDNEDIDTSDIDPRHLKRIHHMNVLFAYSFGKREAVEDEDLEYLDKVIADLEEIDEDIRKIAPERPLSEINKVDLAILRTVVFESRHKKTPKKVLIDEAVELAKEFGTDSSSAFVNAVLGKVVLSNEASDHDQSAAT